MKPKFIILLFLTICLTGCKQQVNKKESKTNSEIEVTQPQETASYITDWANVINDKDLQNLEQLYASDAIKVLSADKIINNSAEISTYYRNQEKKIAEIESLFTIEANKGRDIHYELIKYKTEDLKEYVQLLIWSLEGEKVIREFEFTEESKVSTKSEVISDIAKRRTLWVELCNENNAENLVKQLYTPNTIYFNHKPIIQGVEAVVKEYGYMNNTNYTLNLEPIHLEAVNNDLVFEIGQCSGSYGGKYILIWEKQSSGDWKIYIDSNI